jgi:phosphoglycolate phosphatase-like HAD superfamily hydrolase
MSGLKLIIFDFDGPILDSFDVAKKSIFEVEEKLAREDPAQRKKLPFLAEEVFITSWGYPGIISLQKLFPALAPKELMRFMDVWKDNEKEQILNLVKGAKETLAWLKKENYLIGLLTSRSQNLDLHLRRLSLGNFFDFVQSWLNPEAADQKCIHQNHFLSPLHKPNPQVFENIFRWAEEKQIKKGEMLLIDDTLVGLEAARGAGIHFLGVCTGPLNSKEKWQKYGNLGQKYVINSIAELPEWLKMRV